MRLNLVACATGVIDAPKGEVWRALTDPRLIKQYMFGADVITDWKVDSPIYWKGVFNGKRYEDKGRILAFDPEERLQFTHFSPMSGKPDEPENYHTITIDLEEENGKTKVELTQDNNDNESDREHAENNWTQVLDGLKRVVER
ncbi:MAG TPA: SRPBCC family protein [Candidatus Krumholzibacteria bacterium]|nr:SRPBCC family protein [Candidatus Krumholzibacteria bacterium]